MAKHSSHTLFFILTFLTPLLAYLALCTSALLPGSSKNS